MIHIHGDLEFRMRDPNRTDGPKALTCDCHTSPTRPTAAIVEILAPYQRDPLLFFLVDIALCEQGVRRWHRALYLPDDFPDHSTCQPGNRCADCRAAKEDR